MIAAAALVAVGSSAGAARTIPWQTYQTATGGVISGGRPGR